MSGWVPVVDRLVRSWIVERVVERVAKRVAGPCGLVVAVLLGVTSAGASVLNGDLRQYFDQDTGLIPDLGEAGDLFGASLAAGDFNCDGFADLAFGAPFEDLVGAPDGGQVTVVFGSADGLDHSDTWFLSQNMGLLDGGPAGEDFRFGAALAAGNFDDDGCDDLAIGIPGLVLELGHVPISLGGVMYLPGAPSGFSFADSLLVHYQVGFGTPSAGAEFGRSLVAGDFNADSFDDLAIGAPGKTILGEISAGEVAVVFGGPFGLSPTSGTPSQILTQEDFGGTSTAQDRFGQSLAAGNFDRFFAFDDLAIGAPFDDDDGQFGAGAVYTVYGGFGGLDETNVDIWTQTNLLGSAESHGRFGTALAAGNFNGDVADDLAIGRPGSVSAEPWESVHVLFGVQGQGLTPVADQSIANGFPAGPGGVSEFGVALASADFDLDGFGDLAISNPRAQVDGAVQAGAVLVLTGSAIGVLTTGPTLHQSPGLGELEPFDLLGDSLAVADFDGDGLVDLAAGAPFEDSPSGASEAGGVNVFYGGPFFEDDFESGDLSAWPVIEP